MKLYNIFFSPTGNTRRIAMYFSKKLNTTDINLANRTIRDNLDIEYDSLSIVSIPTYSQNIPIPLRKCLKNIKSKFVVINVTYGGMSYGNIVYELDKVLSSSTCIGYSVTPVKHAYLNNEIEIDFSKYNILVDRIRNKAYKTIRIPYKQKNIFANFLEKNRTIFNYKIKYDSDLCNLCNLCIDHCPVQAIDTSHKISDNCIRCGRCVNHCPTNALTAKQSLPLRIYLHKKAKTNVIIR